MSSGSWTIGDILQVAADYLKKKGISNPRLSAEILLSHQLNLDRIDLYLNFDRPLTEKEVERFRLLIKRRAGREPIQYITGIQEFWSMDFSVRPGVLVPRPETEILVEQAIARIKAMTESEADSPRILDMGTGCGVLAVSLAKELQNAEIWATDISADALATARFNAEKHGMLKRIQFLEGDLYEPVSDLKTTFDLILSNPPYVASEEYNDLPPEVRNHEPRLALDGGEEGLYFIDKIISGAPDYLRSTGWIMIEMAPNQTEKAVKLLTQMNCFGKISRIKDYSHLYRVVMAKKLDM